MKASRSYQVFTISAIESVHPQRKCYDPALEDKHSCFTFAIAKQEIVNVKLEIAITKGEIANVKREIADPAL